MTADPVSPVEATPLRRFLLALVAAVCRRPRLVLLGSLILCGLSVFAACTRLQYRTSRNDLISPRKNYQQRWRKYLAEFGDDDDMVVVVKGTEVARLEQAVEAIAERIRSNPELLDRLFYKADLRSLRNRALLFLPRAELESIRDNLGGMGPLLELGPLGWSNLSLANLLRDAAGRLARRRPGQALSPADEQFFGQLRAVCDSARISVADPDQYRNPWGSLMQRPAGEKDQLAEPQYFLTDEAPDGRLAFLLVRPVKEAGSFTAALKSVEALRSIVAEVRPAFAGLDFGLTGMPVLENDEMAAAQHDSGLASWLAIAGVTLLFLVVYRGIAYPLLTVTTLLVGTVWALGWLTITVGHLNILSATFAVMLIGMGDYGVLWVMRYEQARRMGTGVREALLHTTTHVAVGNLTAATTLALAFFAALFADFQAVAELGWIAGCGVLLCAFACFTVLPALCMVFDKREAWSVKRESKEGPAMILPFPTLHASRSTIHDRTWLPWLARRPGWVLTGGALVIVAAAVCACQVKYDHNLLHLQAQNLESVRWETTLIERTAGASWHALSIADSAETALELKARYEKLPEVSRVVEVATLVPPDQDLKLGLVRDIGGQLTYLPPRGQTIFHLPPSSRAVEIQVAELSGLLGASAGRGLLAELRQSLQALDEQLKGTKSVDADACLLMFDQRLAGDLAEDLHRLRDVATSLPIKLDDLPPDLRERHVSPRGRWLLRIFARDARWDFEPLERFCQAVRTVDPEATGKPFGTIEGLKAMKGGLTRAGVYAFLVIAAVLYLDFRRVSRTLLALTPLLVGVLLSLGVMGLCGFPLNPANMIAFPLILGVGVDNGVHVLHDYLIRRAERRPSVSFAIGRGVLVKALTTMIGFGMLMISTERGLAGLGFILTLGVGCSMLASLVLLPALLALASRPARPTVEKIAIELPRAA
jgi:hopanoid biosynthesis associated RND transporter like protein HpnN